MTLESPWNFSAIFHFVILSRPYDLLRNSKSKPYTYENMNVDLSRTPMNVSYKSCGDLTYNERLDQMIAEGMVSLKGLKADATLFDEMIMDVNTDYFEQKGGYDYACRFYEEAFHFAEKLYGADNVISAVIPLSVPAVSTKKYSICRRPLRKEKRNRLIVFLNTAKGTSE